MAFARIAEGRSGLKDLQRFFVTLGDLADMAIVLVPQLDAKGCSLPMDRVQRHTALRIVEVTTRATLNVGYIYLCPADAFVELRGDINDILDLSKIEAGKFDIDIERFNPARVIEDVRSIMAGRAAEKGLSLDGEYRSAIPQRIKSDAKRLKQILINLVGNAIKFTKRGSVKIVVEFVSIPASKKTQAHCTSNQLRVHISDSGIGITPEQQGRLFKPFYQGDSSIIQQFGGTGLGLAISQRLATMLGGEINVTSKLNQGSTFTLMIATGEVRDEDLIHPTTANAMQGCNAPRVPTVTCKTLNAAFFCVEVALRADLINAKLRLQVLLDQLSHRLG